MTAQRKAGMAGGITLVGVVAVLQLWPHLQPVLTWVWTNAGVVLGREQVQAVLAAIALATCVGVALPRWLPGDWTPARTRTVTGCASALLAFSAALMLVPTRIGFVYAMLALFAGPTVSSALRQLWYWAQPEAKPDSLQPPPPGEST